MTCSIGNFEPVLCFCGLLSISMVYYLIGLVMTIVKSACFWVFFHQDLGETAILGCATVWLQRIRLRVIRTFQEYLLTYLFVSLDCAVVLVTKIFTLLKKYFPFPKASIAILHLGLILALASLLLWLQNSMVEPAPVNITAMKKKK